MFVSGGHVCVRSEHRGNFSVEIPAHGLLFRCGFGVHVDDDYFHVRWNLRALAICGAKRVIERGHECAALQVHYGITDAALCFSYVNTCAWKSIREIRRA